MNITDKQAEAWVRAFHAVGIDTQMLAEAIIEIGETLQIINKIALEIGTQIAGVAGWLSSMAYEGQTLEEIMKEFEKRGAFDSEPPSQKKKRERNLRQVAERANAARFSRYKARESSQKQKRMRPRRREWRGPWKENKQ